MALPVKSSGKHHSNPKHTPRSNVHGGETAFPTASPPSVPSAPSSTSTTPVLPPINKQSSALAAVQNERKGTGSNPASPRGSKSRGKAPHEQKLEPAATATAIAAAGSEGGEPNVLVVPSTAQTSVAPSPSATPSPVSNAGPGHTVSTADAGIASNLAALLEKKGACMCGVWVGVKEEEADRGVADSRQYDSVGTPQFLATTCSSKLA